MGYTTRNGIKAFTPDDTDVEIYLEGSASLEYILERMRAKWGADTMLDDVEISSEYIHTDCLGYDKYDPGDYTNYVVVTLQK